MSQRLLVTGSRTFADRALVTNALAWVWHELGSDPACVLVHGDARGLDTLAAGVWTAHALECEAHPADWARFGRSAGHRRNAEMVALGADLCLAFPLGVSRGTRGCMALAERAGIRVVTVTL